MTLAVVVAMVLAAQALGFRAVNRRQEPLDGQFVVESQEPNWDEYSDAVDNGINAILSLRDIRFPQQGDANITDTLQSLVGPLQAVVPFIPPPAGLVIGGTLSLISGLFGWGEGDGMAALSEQIEQGFKKVTAKLNTIIKTLDLVRQAVERVEALTREVLDRVIEIRHLLDMATITDVHFEYRTVMRRMEAASMFPEDRDSTMKEILTTLRTRTGNLEVMIEGNFTPAKVEAIVMGVYSRNGNAGKCEARELLDDIVSVRLEAYALLMLTVMDPNTGRVNQPFAWMYTNHLSQHLKGYKRIRETVQGRSDLPWDWAPAQQGKEKACAGGQVRQIDSDSRSLSSASDKCAGDNNCVGCVTRSTGEFRYDRIARRWLLWRLAHTSRYYSNGTCFGPTSVDNCPLVSHLQGTECWKYWAKVYRKCWD